MFGSGGWKLVIPIGELRFRWFTSYWAYRCLDIFMFTHAMLCARYVLRTLGFTHAMFCAGYALRTVCFTHAVLYARYVLRALSSLRAML